jgi:Flp pilus assembly protein TadG
MSAFWRKPIGNEQGATIVMVAVSLAALLAAAAIAIDLGMLLDTRGESQRATDAAALAGASALLDYDAPEDEAKVQLRAREYASLNTMRGSAIQDAEIVDVELDRTQALVRVTVQRPAVETWFANIFGVASVPVGSRSAARAVGSGTANCLKPFAVPDHAYSPATYGELRLVVDSRDDEYVLVGFGGGPPGGGNFHDDIRLPCNDRTARISLADPWLWAKPSGGLPPGQVRNPFNDLYDSDPGLFYDESDGKFYRTVSGVVVEEPNWRASPRVGNVAVLDHSTIVYDPTGAYMVRIVDFVAVFFEGPPQQCGGTNAYCRNASNTWVYGRFFPAIGEADNCFVTDTCGPNLFRLRLVE